MSQPSTDVPMFFVGGNTSKRRGRPRVEQRSIRVSTWLPESTADRLIALAAKHDESLSKVVRQACDHLARQLESK